MSNHDPSPSSDGTRPLPGLSPTSPQHAAGMRIEPMPSLPCATATMPEATAAAEPPDDPPGVRLRFHGLRVTPNLESVAPKTHSSGTRVKPTTTAPAARSLRTTSWSTGCGVGSLAVDPQRIGSPSTGTLSLTAIGNPARGRPALSGRASTSCASRIAATARTSWKAPIEGSTCSIRWSARSVAVCALTLAAAHRGDELNRAQRHASSVPTNSRRFRSRLRDPDNIQLELFFDPSISTRPG